MKPQELKIGNLVCYNGKVVKVEQVTKRKIGYHTKPNETRLNYAKLCEIKPIPITEEMLLKNNFEQCGYLFKTLFIEMYEVPNGWHLHIDNEKFETVIALTIKYVHQLQNAYYLATGKELEIELCPYRIVHSTFNGETLRAVEKWQPDAEFLIDGIDTYLISEGFNQTGAACAPGESQVYYECSTEDYICSVKACINYK